MNNNSETLREDTVLQKEEDFNLDVLVLGLLAVMNAKNDPQAIVKQFGQEERANSIFDSSRQMWYSVAYRRKRGELGLTLTARKLTSTGEVAFQVWIPMESFRNCKLTLLCEKE